MLSLSETIKAAGSAFTQQKERRNRKIFRPIFCLLDKVSNKYALTGPTVICQKRHSICAYILTEILNQECRKCTKLYTNTYRYIHSDIRTQ